MGFGMGRGMGMGRGAIGAPIARLFAQLIVMGSGVLGRHFLEAYQAALRGAQRLSVLRHSLLPHVRLFLVNRQVQFPSPFR